jgi:hypothetical protein
MEQIHTAVQKNGYDVIIKPGDIFKHYKGNLYKVICISCDSENLTWYVVYETLYDNKVSKIWHRPLDMFLGFVEIDGQQIRRFELVSGHPYE